MADSAASPAATAPDVDDLVARAAAGDEAARTELVERSRRQVHGWCRRILGDAERAEDATQETLLQLWRHIGALRDPRAFPSWLYRLTLNACRRQRQREPSFGQSNGADDGEGPRRCQGSTAPTPEELAIARDELEQLLDGLRTTDRELLSMKYTQELSAREIGRELSISQGAVRTRLHAIIAKLRRLADPGDRWR